MMNNNLKDRLSTAAIAFRGYNINNLGRSTELLAHPVYGAIVKECLHEASDTCAEVTGRKTDLAARVRKHRNTNLKSYAEALALIMAVETAQLRLLKECFDIDYTQARVSFGYSLGELSALVAGGVFSMSDAMRIPLSLAKDSAALADDVTLGVVFSRGRELPLDKVNRVCLHINHEGQGVIGISTYLSPNSLLLMGQGDTLDRLKLQLADVLEERVYLRKNKNRWPPMHTPIVWQRNIPSRSAVMMHTLEGGFTAPVPNVLSLVTGKLSYNDYNAREIIYRWVDHPQRLWDVVYETLAMGIETIIHVGPEPNIIPATFHRLSDNVEAQTHGSIGMRALTSIIRRPWLQALLPARTALLRAPLVEHVILEDWLLAQEMSE